MPRRLPANRRPRANSHALLNSTPLPPRYMARLKLTLLLKLMHNLNLTRSPTPRLIRTGPISTNHSNPRG